MTTYLRQRLLIALAGPPARRAPRTLPMAENATDEEVARPDGLWASRQWEVDAILYGRTRPR